MEVKKNPKLDLNRRRGQFFTIGLVISLAMTITAFEWRSPTNPVTVDQLDGGNWEEVELPPITFHEPPEPPKPKIIPNEVIETTEEVEVPDELVIDNEIGEFDPDEEVFIPEAPAEEVEVIHDIVEEMPTPAGGLAAFYGFLSKKMKYPKQARRMGIEGVVYLQFVVDELGNVGDAKVVKGIGAGCDEEALRVMALAPAWNPGKQRGRPVKVRMMVPIHFKLHN
ncbi:MAG: energy transducer TonB [Bacteroidota bacterium]